MFRLVGSECFKIDKRMAEITISSNGMSFEYILTIDGKSLKKFIEVQAKNTRVWLPKINAGAEHRVVLGMDLTWYVLQCLIEDSLHPSKGTYYHR